MRPLSPTAPQMLWLSHSMWRHLDFSWRVWRAEWEGRRGSMQARPGLSNGDDLREFTRAPTSNTASPSGNLHKTRELRRVHAVRSRRFKKVILGRLQLCDHYFVQRAQ